ncbi:MAG: peptidoglycan DD-metalloendopeptidase family protein [bacterium]
MTKTLILILLVLLIGVPSASQASLVGYFTDKTSPVISSDLNVGIPYRGNLTIHFIIKDNDTSVKKVSVYLDDKDVTSDVDFGGGYKKNSYMFDSEKIHDGKHTLTIIADDSSINKNKAVQEISFNIDNTAPLLELASGGGVFAQGKTSFLYFKSSELDVDIDGVFQSKEFRAYPYRGKYRAVLGFSIDDPGNRNYYMKVRAKDRAGNISDYHYKVYVAKTKFGKMSFFLRPKKIEMLMPDVIRADWKKIEDEVVKKDPEKYYRGRFIRPASGRISMAFGLNETINGAESGKHRGLDFANAAGTKIVASNSGIVRLSEYLPAHGNTVVIDHGQGIFTYYAHQKKLLVTVGERVNKGQVIGLMGATGVATGPHLHFAVSLHNLRVDPMQWLNGIVID